jgi:hypothetical protein
MRQVIRLTEAIISQASDEAMEAPAIYEVEMWRWSARANRRMMHALR